MSGKLAKSLTKNFKHLNNASFCFVFFFMWSLYDVKEKSYLPVRAVVK